MSECVKEEELGSMMLDIIMNFSKISKCNERWMAAHKYNASDSKIILMLWDKPDGCTQNEICKMSGVSKQQVSAVLKEFEEKKYIIRTKDTSDERRNKIVLTDYGRDVCLKVNNDFNRFFRYMLEKVTDKERKDVMNTLSFIVDVYSKSLDERGY